MRRIRGIVCGVILCLAFTPLTRDIISLLCRFSYSILYLLHDLALVPLRLCAAFAVRNLLPAQGCYTERTVSSKSLVAVSSRSESPNPTVRKKQLTVDATRRNIKFGARCVIDAKTEQAPTTTAMAGAGFKSANDGGNSRTSLPIWASVLTLLFLLIASTMTATTSRKIADGQQRSSKPTIDAISGLRVTKSTGCPAERSKQRVLLGIPCLAKTSIQTRTDLDLAGTVKRASASQVESVKLSELSSESKRTNNCPAERGAVKNLADAQAADAYANPIKQLTVADLAAMPPRPKNVLLLYGDKRFPEEMFHVRVTAILVGFKLESDEDYHVVIADPEDRSKTMIVEIPSPDCITLDLRTQMQALRDAFDASFGKPTGKYKKARPGVTVSVEGILFRDFAHGQTGAAPSQTEIHPVLALARD